MSIFVNRNKSQAAVLESSFTDEQLDRIDHSLTGMNEIITESAEMDYKIEAGMYVSDIVMESAIVLEGAQPEVLLENFVKNLWEKIKDAFKALWKKIQGWYQAAIRWFKVTFATGEKLVKDFKREILAKDVGEFTYDGYKFDFGAGNGMANSIESKALDFINKHVDFVRGAEEELSARQEARNSRSDSGSESDLREVLIDNVFNGSISDTVKNVREAYYGKDGKDEVEKFAHTSRDAMIKHIEDKSKTVGAAEKAAKDMDNSFKRVITAIERAESAITGGSTYTESERAAMTTYANKRIGIAKTALGGIQNVNAIGLQATKDAYSQYVRVLKSFLKYKPTKEGFEGIDDHDDDGGDDDKSASLFESAMKWV